MKIRLGPIAIVIACIAVACAFIVQGPQGIQGIQGFQGDQGPQGITGLNGSTGPRGPNGSIGPIGLRGANGSTGPSGNIRGNWVLVGNYTSIGSKTFNLSQGMNSPVKVIWTATTSTNVSAILIVKLIGTVTGTIAIWRETQLGPTETVKGVEVSLINPIETYTLTMSLKTGNISSVRADVYRFVNSEL